MLLACQIWAYYSMLRVRMPANLESFLAGFLPVSNLDYLTTYLNERIDLIEWEVLDRIDKTTSIIHLQPLAFALFAVSIILATPLILCKCCLKSWLDQNKDSVARHIFLRVKRAVVFSTAWRVFLTFYMCVMFSALQVITSKDIMSYFEQDWFEIVNIAIVILVLLAQAIFVFWIDCFLYSNHDRLILDSFRALFGTLYSRI